jgi:hypothetical protein
MCRVPTSLERLKITQSTGNYISTEVFETYRCSCFDFDYGGWTLYLG